jgi:uncharacterized protein (DUF305 family)
MKHEKPSSVGQIARVLVALVAALVVAAPAAASAPAPGMSTATFEVDFLTGMIDHHAMAIEMGEICLDKAEHAQLQGMCQDVISAQSQEIETMQAWLGPWYGVSYEPVMKPGEMRQMEKLAALSGAEFEIRFMEMLIRHHRKAISEAEKCLDRAYHPDLPDLCQGMIEMQSPEIAQLESWLCQWYGRCRGRR